MVTANEPRVRLILRVWYATAAMHLDWQATPAQAERCGAVISPMYEFGSLRRCPTGQDVLVVDTERGKFGAACVNDRLIAHRSTGYLVYASCPDFELMSLFRTQRKASKQINHVQALSDAPDVEFDDGLRVPCAGRIIESQFAHSKSGVDQLHDGHVIGPLAQTKSGHRRWPPLRMSSIPVLQ